MKTLVTSPYCISSTLRDRDNPAGRLQRRPNPSPPTAGTPNAGMFQNRGNRLSETQLRLKPFVDQAGKISTGRGPEGKQLLQRFAVLTTVLIGIASVMPASAQYADRYALVLRDAPLSSTFATRAEMLGPMSTPQRLKIDSAHKPSAASWRAGTSPSPARRPPCSTPCSWLHRRTAWMK